MRPTASPHLPDSPLADCHLRAASVTDAAALAALLQQLAPDEPRCDTTRLAERLSGLPSSCAVWVAERDGQLLGTCTLNLIEHLAHNFARSAILQDVVVDGEARGFGVGQALMANAIEHARAWGCYKVALSSSQSREAAHAFYAGLAFKPHGISVALQLN